MMIIAQARELMNLEPAMQMRPIMSCIMPLASAPRALRAEKARKGDPIMVSIARITMIMPPSKAKMYPAYAKEEAILVIHLPES
jgi:hypothetical protein